MTISLIFEDYPNPNINLIGSVRESIPFFIAMNNQFKICDLEVARTSTNWVYPIPVKNPMLQKSVFINGSRLNSEFFINKINPEIIDLVAKGKGWLCIDFTEEPVSHEVLSQLINYINRCSQESLMRTNLDKVLRRTLILTTQMKSSRHPYISNHQVFSLSCRRENDISVLDSTHMSWIKGKPSLWEQNQVQGNKVFSFFNYDYTSDHVRFTSLALLKKLDLLDYGHISIFNKGKDFNLHYHDYCTMYNRQKLNISFQEIDKVHELLDVKDTLEKVNVNLVIESCYDEVDLDTIYITEKTFRNYFLKKPFLLIGQYETLSALKDIGYKSFHPFINEAYDSEKDGAIRLRMIFKELKRLCSFTEEQWSEFNKQVNPILEHNFNINTNVRPKNSYKLFKEYING
tara:strand:- start:4313 stop:5518 length:1206 start_codon:yes stop_codon:yes gene_type:complete